MNCHESGFSAVFLSLIDCFSVSIDTRFMRGFFSTYESRKETSFHNFSIDIFVSLSFEILTAWVFHVSLRFFLLEVQWFHFPSFRLITRQIWNESENSCRKSKEKHSFPHFEKKKLLKSVDDVWDGAVGGRLWEHCAINLSSVIIKKARSEKITSKLAQQLVDLWFFKSGFWVAKTAICRTLHRNCAL